MGGAVGYAVGVRWVARQPRQEQDRRGGYLVWRLAIMLAAARCLAAVTAGRRAARDALLICPLPEARGPLYLFLYLSSVRVCAAAPCASVPIK